MSLSRHPRRKREATRLLGLALFAQIPKSFAWSGRSLRRCGHPPSLRLPKSPAGRSVCLWVSQSTNGGKHIIDTGRTVDSESHRRSFPRKIASLIARVRGDDDKKMVQITKEGDYEAIKRENELLRDVVRQLELENERLQQSAGRIVIESFEGENKMRTMEDGAWFSDLPERPVLPYGITMAGEEMEVDSSLWCDELEDGQCPVEPTISFGEALRDRAVWLVGLLALQSCSGFILSHNELLLEKHPVIIYFLTMLVGAGGNAGNQASVRVIRGLALGTLNERTQTQFLSRELRMAAALCLILSVAGFLRAMAFRTPLPESIAVTSALALIVFSSVCLGAVLPLVLKKLGVDPAHSSTTIQVIMDILGVVLTVVVSSAVLDSPFGQFLVSRLSSTL